MSLIFPGDLLSKDSDKIEIIDQIIINHRKQYVFTAVGVTTAFSPLSINSKFQSQLYYPIKDHPIVGTILQRCSGGFLVNINNGIPAFISQNDAQKNALQPQDHIACIIKSCQSGHQTQLKLIRPLIDGQIQNISPLKASKILSNQFLIQVGKYVKCECFIGMNGSLWVGGCNSFDTETIFECIRGDEADYQEIITKRKILLKQCVM